MHLVLAVVMSIMLTTYKYTANEGNDIYFNKVYIYMYIYLFYLTITKSALILLYMKNNIFKEFYTYYTEFYNILLIYYLMFIIIYIECGI